MTVDELDLGFDSAALNGCADGDGGNKTFADAARRVDDGGMEITVPDTDEAPTIVDAWVELASNQRQHGSHLEAERNRSHIRESILRHTVTGTLLVARNAQELVGFVMFRIETGSLEQTVRRGVVENLYVVDGERGQGTGSKLLGAAETELASRGADVVALEVMAENDTAREFYATHGYESHRLELEKTLESDTNSKTDE